MFSSLLGALALLLAFSPIALATPIGAHPAQPKVPPLIANQQHVKILAHFAVTSDVTGWIIKISGLRRIAYSLPDGSVFFGGLRGSKGELKDTDYLTRYAPVGNIHQILTATRGFTAGKSGPLLIAFIDPNCGYCHLLWQRVTPLIAAGRLRVRWLPVGIVRPSSAPRAAAILMADNPVAALAQNETTFNTTAEMGGIDPAGRVSEVVHAMLEANLDAMAKLDGVGTPTLVYRASDGTLKVVRGLPAASWLNAYAAPAPKPPAKPKSSQ